MSPQSQANLLGLKLRLSVFGSDPANLLCFPLLTITRVVLLALLFSIDSAFLSQPLLLQSLATHLGLTLQLSVFGSDPPYLLCLHSSTLTRVILLDLIAPLDSACLPQLRWLQSKANLSGLLLRLSVFGSDPPFVLCFLLLPITRVVLLTLLFSIDSVFLPQPRLQQSLATLLGLTLQLSVFGSDPLYLLYLHLLTLTRVILLDLIAPLDSACLPQLRWLQSKANLSGLKLRLSVFGSDPPFLLCLHLLILTRVIFLPRLFNLDSTFLSQLRSLQSKANLSGLKLRLSVFGSDPPFLLCLHLLLLTRVIFLPRLFNLDSAFLTQLRSLQSQISLQGIKLPLSVFESDPQYL
jgi:hypothetical protein